MTDLETAKQIAQLVEAQGGRAYFVGGCVRDKLLGCPCKDIDIEIHGIPGEKLRELLGEVGTVLEHGRSFGVYGLAGRGLDISLPRDDNGCEAPNIGTFEAARRRDLTLNSIMENVLTGQLTDHFGGREDIERKLLRRVDDDTFASDPLRVFRTAQLAARYGFSVEEETLDLCRKTDVSQLAGERVMGEISKALLRSERPSVFFEELRKMEQLSCWMPELEALIGVPQNRYYHQEGDVWVHTMMVVDEAAKRRDTAHFPLGIMMSALCHDFGKAVATTEENGVVHSYGHETEGLPLVRSFLARLTSDKRLKRYVLNMTQLHMDPNKLARSRSKLKRTNRMFDLSVEPFDLIQLSICDGLGKLPQNDSSEQFLMERYEKFCRIMERPFVSGKDLIEAGISPGEEMAQILEYAHKLRLAGLEKENVLRQSLAYARSVLKMKI